MPTPSAVLHLTPKWSEHIMVDPRTEHLCKVTQAENGSLNMTLRLDTDRGQIPIGIDVRIGDPDGDFDPQGRCLAIRRWGLRRLGAGTWQLVPSVVHGPVHAYVVLTEVPEPAPFAHTGLLASAPRTAEAVKAEETEARRLLRLFRDSVRYVRTHAEKEALATRAERLLGLTATAHPLHG
jgi:hypothetical protein